MEDWNQPGAYDRFPEGSERGPYKLTDGTFGKNRTHGFIATRDEEKFDVSLTVLADDSIRLRFWHYRPDPGEAWAEEFTRTMFADLGLGEPDLANASFQWRHAAC